MPTPLACSNLLVSRKTCTARSTTTAQKSEAFKVSSGVKQGLRTDSTLFGIFFSMLLQYAFKNCREGVFLHTRSDGKLLNIARLRVKTSHKGIIRKMLFADDTAMVSQTEEGLQQLVNRLSHACKEFGLKISLKKTNVMAQDAGHPPTLPLTDTTWKLLKTSPTSGPQSRTHYPLRRGQQQNCQGKQQLAKLKPESLNNSSLTEKTRIHVYQACVLSTLLYGSESWTTYARHEKKLNSFHQRWLRRILHIKWQDEQHEATRRCWNVPT